MSISYVLFKIYMLGNSRKWDLAGWWVCLSVALDVDNNCTHCCSHSTEQPQQEETRTRYNCRAFTAHAHTHQIYLTAGILLYIMYHNAGFIIIFMSYLYSLDIHDKGIIILQKDIYSPHNREVVLSIVKRFFFSYSLSLGMWHLYSVVHIIQSSKSSSESLNWQRTLIITTPFIEFLSTVNILIIAVLTHSMHVCSF